VRVLAIRREFDFVLIVGEDDNNRVVDNVDRRIGFFGTEVDSHHRAVVVFVPAGHLPLVEGELFESHAVTNPR